MTMIGYDFNPTGTNIAHMPWAHCEEFDEDNTIRRNYDTRKRWRPKYLDRAVQIVRDNPGITYTQVARKAYLSNNAGVLCQLADFNLVYMDERDGLHVIEER